MSTWLTRPEKKSSNPAAKFLDWKSNDKCFAYWDKEKKENVQIQLPLKFVIIEHYHTVKGWNDASESGIYANEVLFTGSEEMTVRSFKGGEIAKGVYKDIKAKVNAAGGKYHRSIYAVTKDLEIINISLKGASVRSYSDFIEKETDRVFTTNWIEVSEFEEGKKGSVKYTTPIFKKSDPIKDVSKIQPFAEILQTYMNDYREVSKERVNSEVDKYDAKHAESNEDAEVDF